MLTRDSMVDTQQPTEHKESFVEKILDHHHKHGDEGQAAKDKPQGGEGGLRSELEKGEAGLKEYIKEDEQLEEEGQTYGGLM
ncbi:hypothetical protein N7474_002296 [Penicillium riverlandense]|uniref:uncharacterized protein n=1 Tax=Penicillium riverlandense TaxID=1903569 RepID=UPI00254823A3|nr:uncharacterized protein N7474_002296 [Penicillium riverlandense]KAJ5825158.1 hypothetical protein N7474_002296 [Penicillium riverlandense]